MNDERTEHVETRGHCEHCGYTIKRDDSRHGLWLHLGTRMRRCAGTHIDTEATPMDPEQLAVLLGAGEL